MAKKKIELVYNATAAREKSISKRKLYDMGGGWGGSPSKCSGVFLLTANVSAVILSEYISLWETVH